MAHRSRVLVIEPSEIVAKGLSSILEASGQYSANIAHDLSAADSAWQYDLIIVNPVLAAYRSDVGEHFPASIPLLALVYFPYDESLLKSFDAVLSLGDDSCRILRKISDALQAFAQTDKSAQQDLTGREKEILAEVAKGATNKEIADRFSLSVNTVMTHRKNISRKTGINSISGLTVYAIMNKLVDMKDLR